MTRSDRLLVIGLGSAGMRHARLAQEIDVKVATVSRRSGTGSFADIETAISAFKPTHIVIANETNAHWPTLRKIRENGVVCPIMLEKPVSNEVPESSDVEASLNSATTVAYNLRFHPGINVARDLIADGEAINASFLAGQDLNTWRPGRNLRESYSASATLGGGVLRDLSHELDLVAHLLGPIKRVAALGGKIGPLETDSDDAWTIIAETERCRAVSVVLDYYHSPGVRRITINNNKGTFDRDLRAIEDRDLTYRAQLTAFLDGTNAGQLCTIEEGIGVMRVIAAIERAAESNSWEYL